MVTAAAVVTPLCPAGHLPHKGGDQQVAPSLLKKDYSAVFASPREESCNLTLGLTWRVRYSPISPLVGEMSGRTEGGDLHCAAELNEEHDMPHAPVPPKLRNNAKSMRKVMTNAELKLWNAIRAHRLMGLGFRRQVPIAGYIADFACPTHQLIIEVDGSQHGSDHDLAYDTARTQRLQKDGWTVLRFGNDDVLTDIDNICLHILKTVGEA
ncbi:hypothetical protein GCM10010924_00630 [Rhizobium wenxiniae]|nr:hypothetical protein GCM10010924_00630 [Rhizobium wenxiniae]